jgi:hypothetical protein
VLEKVKQNVFRAVQLRNGAIGHFAEGAVEVRASSMHVAQCTR